MADLKLKREELQTKILDLDLQGKGEANACAFIKNNWVEAHRLIKNWWDAYKEWEEKEDTFNAAVQDNRMTMRSFGSDFDTQVRKTKPVGIGDSRFYGNWAASGRREVLDPAAHKTAYADMDLPQHKRGIDTSAYANPANFASRKARYDAGLHDLSVKLVVPGSDLKASSHHAAQPTPHFVFLPLSQGEDQYVIYKLIQCAKALKKDGKPDLDTLVRTYRGLMTRVKLASDYDMGTGYGATPTPNRDDGLEYKVTYGLGGTLKERGKKVPPPTTKTRLQERQQMYFKRRADIVKYGGNEVVIAMRQHKGGFPVYAVYVPGSPPFFQCFTIDANGRMVTTTGKTITANGVANFDRP